MSNKEGVKILIGSMALGYMTMAFVVATVRSACALAGAVLTQHGAEFLSAIASFLGVGVCAICIIVAMGAHR